MASTCSQLGPCVVWAHVYHHSGTSHQLAAVLVVPCQGLDFCALDPVVAKQRSWEYLRRNLPGGFRASNGPMTGTATVDATGLLVWGPACHNVDPELTSCMWVDRVGF